MPPLVKVLGWPATKIGGAAGLLARGNATRNPSRTAQTAAALMIGLALVTFVAVLAAGLRSRFTDAVDQLFVANYAVTATNNFSPISVSSENALRKVPGVRRGLRRARRRRQGVRIDGSTSPAVEPNVSQVINVKWQDGSPQTPAQLGNDGAFVNKDYAKAQHLKVGSPLDGSDPDRFGHAPDAARHLHAAEGRQPVRRRDDLDGAV